MAAGGLYIFVGETLGVKVGAVVLIVVVEEIGVADGYPAKLGFIDLEEGLHLLVELVITTIIGTALPIAIRLSRIWAARPSSDHAFSSLPEP